MNSYFHDIYFTKHSFNTERDVELANVDSVKEAEVLNRRNDTISPCSEDFYSGKKGKAGLLFIKMEHSKDFTSWLALAKCLRIWDLDARGFHRGMWRLHLAG